MKPKRGWLEDIVCNVLFGSADGVKAAVQIGRGEFAAGADNPRLRMSNRSNVRK